MDKHHFSRVMTPTFARVLAAWYGPNWRRIAAAALGRSRRTVARWCADDALVPRRVWLRFATSHVAQRSRDIDGRKAEKCRCVEQAAAEQKSAILIVARLVDDRLRRTEFEPPPRRGRVRKSVAPRKEGQASRT
jgi:hypothetical protein